MLEWSQYSHLHVVRNLRSMVGKWWNSDIFFLNDQEEFSTPVNEKYFYNSLVYNLFKNKFLKNNLSQFLRDKTSQSKEPVMLEWVEIGVNVLAVPIFKDKHWAGVVGIIGFVVDSEQLKKVQSNVCKYN